MKIEIFTLILQILTVAGWVIVYFFYLKKDLELIKKDVEIMKVDVSKIEWIEGYIKNLSNYFKDWNFKWVPDRLKNYSTSHSRYYESNSPLKLTTEWENLIYGSGFDEVFEEKRDFIMESIKQSLDWKENLEVFFYYAELFSIKLIEEFYEWWDKILDWVRQYIFENGLSDEEEQVIKTIWLYLRDKVIEEYWRKEEFKKLIEAKSKK